jgi:hypothetical protein
MTRESTKKYFSFLIFTFAQVQASRTATRCQATGLLVAGERPQPTIPTVTRHLPEALASPAASLALQHGPQPQLGTCSESLPPWPLLLLLLLQQESTRPPTSTSKRSAAFLCHLLSPFSLPLSFSFSFSPFSLPSLSLSLLSE